MGVNIAFPTEASRNIIPTVQAGKRADFVTKLVRQKALL